MYVEVQGIIIDFTIKVTVTIKVNIFIKIEYPMDFSFDSHRMRVCVYGRMTHHFLRPCNTAEIRTEVSASVDL